MKISKKTTILLTIVLLIVIGLFVAIYSFSKTPTKAGEKNITVEVVLADGSSKKFKFNTNEKYLGDVLVSEGLVKGEEGSYGLFIDTVDGVQADASKQEWWCLTKKGEQLTTGADSTPISDGDVFELTLTVGW